MPRGLRPLSSSATSNMEPVDRTNDLGTKQYKPFPTPFDLMPKQDGWPDAPPRYLTAPYSLQEIDMCALSYALRSKPDWARKLADPEIRAKWRREALAARTSADELAEMAYQRSEILPGGVGVYEPVEGGPRKLSEEHVDFVLDELVLHAQELEDPSAIRASCFDGIYESDSLVPAALLDQLKQHVAHLEAHPPYGEPDWHPGSDQQVLDLVHPSLFPLRYGITPVRAAGEPEATANRAVEAAPEPRNAFHSTSERFQWLPADFNVDVNGKTTISSYINNLHPVDHAPLYLVLAAIFDRFVPMFERVLSDLQEPAARRIEIDWEMTKSWYTPPPPSIFLDREKWEEWDENKVLVIPTPAPFDLAVGADQLCKRKENPAFPLRGRELQVIVKVASIHLTPEKPDYPGGVWHVEGMQNEEIVASGIYYFDQLNIGESRLAFRGTFDDQQVPYEQGDVRGVKNVFGIDPDGPCVQYLNSATTLNGRALAWPNILQHRVAPFSLADRTQPGHRKILVFFLVDPLKPVISTARVPFQQREWVERELPRTGQMVKMPAELWHLVLDHVDGLMTYQEAKEVREELMKERKYLVEENTEWIFERIFSLCEH